jgi:hypothetical protein
MYYICGYFDTTIVLKGMQCKEELLEGRDLRLYTLLNPKDGMIRM